MLRRRAHVLRHVLLLGGALLIGGAAQANDRLSAEEFAAFVTGKTLEFTRFGRPFGTEQYFNGNRVVWAFEGDQCQFGIWFENEVGNICFIYDNQPGSICWDFLKTTDGKFAARAVGSPPSEDLIVSRISDDSLDCVPPDAGV